MRARWRRRSWASLLDGYQEKRAEEAPSSEAGDSADAAGARADRAYLQMERDLSQAWMDPDLRSEEVAADRALVSHVADVDTSAVTRVDLLCYAEGHGIEHPRGRVLEDCATECVRATIDYHHLTGTHRRANDADREAAYNAMVERAENA